MTCSDASALGLDLGTTSVKLAALGSDGRLGQLRSAPAPRPAGAGARREVDVEQYRAAAESLLADAPPLPLGVASQRSSFVLFERDSGRPRTPLISWQDRRAAAWCDRHRDLEPELVALTGLPLSAHYAGPKLAALCEDDPSLRPALESGALLFGTLETYLTWHWSAGEHRTDLSMAARTQLVELQTGDWSARALELFGVPRAALPAIAPTAGRDLALRGGQTLAASLADQAAGLIGVLGETGQGTLVNLGTGAFVLRATGTDQPRVPGYLTGPLLGTADGRARFALEGTINGGGATVDRLNAGPTPLPALDPTPRAFCLPDENGIGAPHWNPHLGLVFSGSAPEDPATRRRLALEGLVFRVREICDDLDASVAGRPLLLSGGLTQEPFLAPALAACLAREVHVLLEEQTTLLGAARLAASGSNALESSAPAPHARVVSPTPEAAWLPAKYHRWRAWLSRQLGE